MDSKLTTADTTEDYLKILIEEYRVRRTKNKKYSIRAFAKFLGLSHSMLSQIFLNQKGISEQMAERIAEKLHLSTLEKNIFINSVLKCFARSSAEKIKAAATLEKLKVSYANSALVKNQGLPNINHWSYLAIFESICLQKANTIDTIAAYLNLPARNIEQVLNHLIQMNVIQIQEEKIVSLSNSIRSADDIPSLSAKDYHLSVNEKMNEALELLSVNEREFQNSILSFPTEQMLEAKKMIRDFVVKFNSQFHLDSPTPPLYSLAVGFFKLNKG